MGVALMRVGTKLIPVLGPVLRNIVGIIGDTVTATVIAGVLGVCLLEIIREDRIFGKGEETTAVKCVLYT